MFVLHAHWQPPTQPSQRGLFLFWAESSDASGLGKRSASTRQAYAHPFAAAAHTVRALLERLAAPTTLSALIDTKESIELVLPSAKTGPVPSPLLVHEWDLAGVGDPNLAPWQMPAC